MIDSTATETVGLVQQFVERTGQLYSLPAVAAEALHLTAETQVNAADLKACLEHDPALTVRILRVVNSSLFGPPRHVSDLSQALTLLGIRPLRMLVLGFSLPRELFAGLEADVLARYWRRTLVKAVAARELSEQLWHHPGDEAFLAGLVQDIGQLALIQQLGQSYLQLLEYVETYGGAVLDREQETLGFDHRVLTARLLAHWGLPQPFCHAVAVPPDEASVAQLEARDQTLAQVLHLAELIVRLVEQPHGSALSELRRTGQQYCGLNDVQLKHLLGSIDAKVQELAAVLSLALPDGQTCSELLIAAQARLAEETLSFAMGISDEASEAQIMELTGQLRREVAAAASREAIAALPRGAHSVASAAANTSNSAKVQHVITSQRRGFAGPPTTSDSSLHARVAAAIQRSRQAHQPLSIVLLEIDRFSDVLLELGPAGAAELLHWLQIAVTEWTGERSQPVVVSDSRLAAIWEDCPRGDAVRLARQVLAAAKPWSKNEFPLGCGLTLSGGVATLDHAPKNLSAAQLVEVAERCLSGAQLSGGDTAKSIDA
jgi:HD-like signal output (HDOD) protein/GGDEF domain-containing protein